MCKQLYSCYCPVAAVSVRIDTVNYKPRHKRIKERHASSRYTGGQGSSETQVAESKHEVAAVLALDMCPSPERLFPFLWEYPPLRRREHRFQLDSQQAEEEEGDP